MLTGFKKCEKTQVFRRNLELSSSVEIYGSENFWVGSKLGKEVLRLLLRLQALFSIVCSALCQVNSSPVQLTRTLCFPL